MNDIKIKSSLIGIGLCILLLIIVRGCEYWNDDNIYNDGVCYCGGHFHYEQAVGHKYFTNYIYACDKCGRRIEICYNP